MRISTKGLVLREFTAEEVDAVHAHAADPAVCAFVEWGPNTVDETVAFLHQCREEKLVRPRQTVTLAVTRNSIVIGSVALMLAESDLVRGPGEAEIGYVLRADAWGRGVRGGSSRGRAGVGPERLRADPGAGHLPAGEPSLGAGAGKDRHAPG